MADLDEKRVIEAALFISSRELSVEELRRLTGIGALGYLQKTLANLVNEYNERGSALEIVEADGKYTMRIRNEYLPRVKQFAQEMEISRSALRTLAYVAKHDGVLKSEAVKHIGTQVYEDVKELVQSGFLRTQKSGRSAKLSVTEKFRKYFIQAKAAVKEEPIKQTTLPETAPADAPEPQQYDEEIMEK